MLEGYIPMDPVIMEANEYGITEYYLNMEEYEKIIEYYTLWIQPYLLRKYDWGMMTRLAEPSQTVAMDP
jgi:hypothetical protein